MRLRVTKRPGLGRIPSPPDPRDYSVAFLKAAVLKGTAIPITWDQANPVLNQGQTGHCVGFAGVNFLGSSQYNGPADKSYTNDDGHALYYRVKVTEGRDQPDKREEGATIRGLMKTLRDEGDIDYYGFGSFEESQDWIQQYGSVVWGTNWYESMFNPDESGVVFIRGKVAGGHAWLQNADKLLAPAENGGLNTWSSRWGKNGRFYLSEETLYRLRNENGEAAMAVKLLEAVPHWPDLPAMNEDDLLSQDAVWRRNVMKGFPPDDEHPTVWFGPGLDTTRHQLGTIMTRLGIYNENPWDHPADYVTPITRGAAKESITNLPFREERWEENMNRFQLLLLVGRMLRGVR